MYFTFEQSASAVSASNFAQYKGELMISLKYVTPQKPTTEKTKGKNGIGKLHLALALNKLCLTFESVSLISSLGKKSVMEEGGELHVLIKEAKNLMAMKTGGTSDSFVKGLVRISPSLKNTLAHCVLQDHLN